MRIALIHSFYRSDAPSGENVVVMRQADALRSAGHEVLVVARHTDDEMSARLYGLKSAVRVASGHGPDPTSELKTFGPDVTHVHNLFPNFGERWLDRWEGPLVATLHNFRPICANALLFREGATCTECVDGNPLPAIRHACYQNSRIATVPLALRNAGGLGRNRLIRRADRLIVLSERSKRVFAEAGGEEVEQKLVVVPNGIEDTSQGDRPPPQHWAFVGRLSPEKGIRELLEAWPVGEPLRVAGDGPLLEGLRALGRPGVTFDGAIASHDVDELLSAAWGLVFPSRCLETGGPPLSVAEAAMHGVPVLARAGSTGADFVDATGAGLTYSDDREVAGLLQQLRAGGSTFSRASRSAYTDHLSVDAWLKMLEDAYAQALQTHGGPTASRTPGSGGQRT